jgi:hypothetical protein
MKKHIIMIIFGAGIYFTGSAQNKTGHYRFSSINNFGAAGGDNTVAAVVQSVNGARRDKWFAGLGAGLDFYLYRTIPVFIDVRREFGEKKNKLFVYADAGLNIEWLQGEFMLKPNRWDPNLRNKYHNGLYTDAGIGFSAGTKKDHAIIFSLGHSVKTFKESRWYSDWRTGQPAKDVYKFNFSRIVLKVGWRF